MVMLSDDSRRDSRMVWLMVSNAAVRLRRMWMFRLPESEERRRSLVILRRAVSVRNPDVNGLKRLLELRWDLSWEATTCSRSFDKKG